jgi:hypothetical protein
MKRKRHSEGQIIAILKERKDSMKTAHLCRKDGISEATFDNRKRARAVTSTRQGACRHLAIAGALIYFGTYFANLLLWNDSVSQH